MRNAMIVLTLCLVVFGCQKLNEIDELQPINATAETGAMYYKGVP